MRRIVSISQRLAAAALFAWVAAFPTFALGAEPPAKPKRTPLWNGPNPPSKAAITIHRPARGNGAAAVICPGGGYGGLVTGGEGHGIARWLNEHGILGVVLEYELPRGRSMVPLRDAQRAIRTVRARAKELNIQADRIGIMGFSAGGHLASTAGTHFDPGDPKATDPIDRASCRPDFMILVYPVITMGEKTHRGSRRNLLGKTPTPEQIALFSNEKQVTKNTPPAYLAHALDDQVVVPENSKMFHDALKANGVASEYLELPRGGHGLNGFRGPMWDAWQAGSIQWLADRKMIPASSGQQSGEKKGKP
ncbi:MAG: alpha/beta hydrolase [Planctomycetales bacterium]